MNQREIIRKIGRQRWEKLKEDEEDLKYILDIHEIGSKNIKETKIYLSKIWKKRKQGERNRINRENENEHGYAGMREGDALQPVAISQKFTYSILFKKNFCYPPLCSFLPQLS